MMTEIALAVITLFDSTVCDSTVNSPTSTT